MSFSLFDLANKVSKYVRAVEIMEELPGWNLRVIYYSLDRKIIKKFMMIGEDNLIVNILKNIDTQDAADCIIEMEWRRAGYMMMLIGERVRKQVLKRLAPDEKAKMVRRIKNYQEELECQWPDGIFKEYVKGERFPAHYPKTIKNCVVCKEGYSLGESVLTADCWKHSFHNKCRQKDVVCPKCKEEEGNRGLER